MNNQQEKVLPSAIRYPLIAALALLFIIGAITLLYERNILPIAGPFVAMAATPVILLFAYWWQGKKLTQTTKKLGSQLSYLNGALVSLGGLPLRWPEGYSKELAEKKSFTPIEKSIINIHLAQRMLHGQHFIEANSAIQNLLSEKPALSQVDPRLEKELEKVTALANRLAKVDARIKRQRQKGQKSSSSRTEKGLEELDQELKSLSEKLRAIDNLPTSTPQKLVNHEDETTYTNSVKRGMELAEGSSSLIQQRKFAEIQPLLDELNELSKTVWTYDQQHQLTARVA